MHLRRNASLKERMVKASLVHYERNEGVEMKRWTNVAIIILCIGALTMLFGCKKDEKEQGADNKGADSHTSQKDSPSAHTYPFTGMESDGDIDHRPIAVMVNNHTTAHPHTGVVDADVVFEILAEGDITRFLALFHSDIPKEVGSVRSAREYYFELAQGYDALYVYHGAANFVNDMIVNRNIDHLNGAVYDNDQQLFKRDPARQAPHNSYVLLDEAYDVAEQKGYDITTNVASFDFTDETTLEGEDAKKVEVGYNGSNPSHLVSFLYDEQSKTYARSEDGTETKDLTTDEPIEVENILIIETAHNVIDSEGRREIDLTSGGNGYLIQQGIAQTIEWENIDGQLIPTKDGQVVPFVQGKTWVNIIPTDPGIQSSVQIADDE